jgi:methyltransferase
VSSRGLYTLLIVAVALARLGELAVSRRHARARAARGAREVGGDHYRWMVALHAGFLLACPAEVWLLDRPFVPALAAVAAGLLVSAMALRYWAIASLGERWTTRVWVLPGEPLVARGPYRRLRHPNYLAVAVEMFAIPLIHTAWLTALVFGIADLGVLAVRIRAEDRALGRTPPPATG